MAAAIVRLRGPLRRLAGGEAEVALEGATVGALLAELEASRPALRGWILDERGRVRRHIAVFVAGDHAGERTAVSPGDRVDILPAISGGAR